jgi:hypothetical protein
VKPPPPNRQKSLFRDEETDIPLFDPAFQNNEEVKKIPPQ